MSSIINDVKSAPETFTSWDKCMSKAYCKWPVIAGIVIGSLILLSVLFCLVQCLCCGYSCAKMLCCCCNGCDCGGKDRRRNRDDRPTKHQDSDYHQLHGPNPYSGYQPPAAMAPAYRGPNTATFESDTKGGDALPAMPSWDHAVSHRIQVNDPPQHKPDDLEMGRLNPQHTRGGYDQIPLSPSSPTHAIPGYFPSTPNAGHQAADMAHQRPLLNQHPSSYNNGFDPSPMVPNSPAPTYQTHAPQLSSSGDRFIAGGISPSPYGYQSQSQPQYNSNTSPYDTPYHHNQPQQRSFSPPSAALRTNTFSPPPAGTMPTSNSYNSFNNNSSAAAPAYEHHRQPSYGGGGGSPMYEMSGSGAARPPSLLQVGRKAVPGSMREV